VDFIADEQTISLQPIGLVVAGWTGRNQEAVQHHIEELAALGIAPPSTVPLYYRVSQNLLTQDNHISVLGPGTSGEVEPLVLRVSGEYWIGLASDHTDRDLEAHSVAASKQACAKPCARTLWRYADVHGHLDQLVLTCDIEESGRWQRYQSGSLAGIRPLDELLLASPLPEQGVMLCGTLAAIGGVRPAASYRMTLEDPVLERSIDLAYQVSVLPVVQ
jgi:hypothetical protein